MTLPQLASLPASSGPVNDPLPRWLPLALGWVMMVLTMTFAEPLGPTFFAGLDAIGVSKMLTRLGAVLLLAPLVAAAWFKLESRRALIHLLPLALFVGWAICSVLWSPRKTESLGQCLSLSALFMLAASTALLVRSRRDVSRLLWHLTVGLLVTCCLALCLHFLIPGGISRTTGNEGMLHPTNVGASACLGLILLYSARLIFRFRWSYGLLLPASALFVILILTAMNRWGPLVAGVLLGLMFLVYAERAWQAVAAVALSICLTLYLALDPGLSLAAKTIESSAGQGQSRDEISSLSGREELWEKITQAHRQSPWKGHGYFITSEEGKFEVWGREGNHTAHNLYLQVLVSTGWIGLALLTLGMLWPLLAMGRRWCFRYHGQMVGFFLLVGLFYLGWGQLNESFAGPLQPESVVCFALVGAAAGLAARNEDFTNYRDEEAAST